jgi:DNA-binding GntR family transcriptional regulator
MTPATNGARRDNVEQVYRRVREAILDGEIAPGTAMSQVGIAEELGVSRTPLREALRMLQSEGWVDAQTNHRVTVRPLSVVDLEQLSVMRIALETQAIRLSVGRLEPEDLAALEGALAEMGHYEQARDFERWRLPHAAFHRGLTARAGERINETLAHLNDHAERYRRVYQARAARPRQNAGHREILDAVKAQDRERSAQLLSRHLADVAFDLTKLLEPDYEPARLRQALEDVGVRPRRRVKRAA